jgi:UDP-glucose 4-epimerase
MKSPAPNTTISHHLPSPARILITGGAGFIGSHVADLHLKRGDTVTVIDDLSTGDRDLLRKGDSERFRFMESDILEWQDLEQETARVDRIYHLAAVVGMFRVLREPIEVTRVNVLGTERVLEAAARSGHLPEIVIASSSSVYSHAHATTLTEEAELVYHPERGGLTGYALSKLTNEIQASAYRSVHGLPVCIPRFFNAIGPGQSGTYGFVLPRFISRALAGKPLIVYGDGTQTRSFCDVRDTVRAIDLLASNPEAWGIPVNVGSPQEITILDLAKLVIERTGSSSVIEFQSYEQGYGGTFWQVPQRKPSLERLHNLTGFQHAWSLEQSIDDLIARNREGGLSGGRLH